jgi:hypothetical protein
MKKNICVSNLSFFILIFLSLNVILACSSNKQEKYIKKKTEEFNKYLNDIHGISGVNGDVFCVIDISVDCNCLDYILNELNEIGICSNLKIIWVGLSSDSIISEKIRKISNNYNIIHDESKRIYFFETGFYKPLIVYFKPSQNYGDIRVVLDKDLKDEMRLLARSCL